MKHPNIETVILNKDSMQRAMGFDFGLRRIGVAIGQIITRSANPLTVLQAKEGIPDWILLDKLMREWRPNALVVGIPINMDGSDQAMSGNAKNFASELVRRFQLPVFEMDERLTTVAAREKIFEKKGFKGLKSSSVDAMAAQLILENWLRENFD